MVEKNVSTSGAFVEGMFMIIGIKHNLLNINLSLLLPKKCTHMHRTITESGEATNRFMLTLMLRIKD